MKYDITQLKPGSNSVSRAHYISILKQVSSPELLAEWDRYEFENFKDADYVVFKGDVESMEPLQCFTFHMLVIGDVLCKWMNCEGPFNGGGTLTITGNLHSLYYSSALAKTVQIGGNMTVNHITLNAHEEATLAVLGNFKTKYYHGVAGAIEVGGSAEMEYGTVAALTLGDEETLISPKQNLESSLAKLNYSSIEEVTVDAMMAKIEAEVEV